MDNFVTEFFGLGFETCVLQLQVLEAGWADYMNLAGKHVVVASIKALAGKYFGEIGLVGKKAAHRLNSSRQHANLD